MVLVIYGGLKSLRSHEHRGHEGVILNHLNKQGAWKLWMQGVSSTVAFLGMSCKQMAHVLCL